MTGSAWISKDRWTMYWYPLTQCALVVLPMLAFSTILMVLVYIYDWQRRPDRIKQLSLSTGLYADVYYVDFSATKLITVASLSSSAVLTLMGSFMTLLSYPVAADLIWNSRLAFTGMLPKPTQLALLIDLLDGKKMAVFEWLSSMWSRQSGKGKSLWMVELAVALQVFITGLCLAITGVDTWLHLSTDAVTMPFFQSADVIAAGAVYQYSRNLYESCSVTDSQDLPCSIRETNGQVQILNQQEIQSLLLNATSAATNIYMDQFASDTAYLGPPATEDDTTQNSAGGLQYPQFNASTYAMLTSCAFSNCSLTTSNKSQGSYAFSCPGGFSSSETNSWFETGPWYQNSSNYTGYLDLASKYGPDVGLQWGVFAHLENFTFIRGTSPRFTINTTDLISGKPSATFVLQCNSSLARSSYTWANNTLTQPLVHTVANQTVLNVALGPFLSQGSVLGFPSGTLDLFRERLAFDKNETSLYAVGQFEMLMSGIGLSFLGASVGPAPASSLQLPNSTILTQVPKLPLFTLVALNMWYAGLAICLCILACFLLAYGDQGKDIIAVRKLLCVEGLTRAAVNNHRSLQGEDIRVGVVKRDGQWHFKVWSDSGEGKGEAEGLLQPVKDMPDTTDSQSLLTDGRLEDLSSASHKAATGTANAEPLREDEGSNHFEEQPVSPVSPVSPLSYNNAFFINDQEERRRISRGMKWADDER